MHGAIYTLLFLGFLLLEHPGVHADPGNASATTDPKCVILLHGLGRTSRSLNRMAEALQAAGLSPANLDYPSREQTIETLALETIERGLDRCTKIQVHTVHFVTLPLPKTSY